MKVFKIADWNFSLKDEGLSLSQDGMPSFSSFMADPDEKADFLLTSRSVGLGFGRAMLRGRSDALSGRIGRHFPWLAESYRCETCAFQGPLSFFFSAAEKRFDILGLMVKRLTPRLNYFLIYLLANFGAINDGVFLHGAGAILDGQAFAVLGNPGAGKSTAIGLIEHDFLLSDDMLMMRFKGEQPVLHATPLGPNSGGPASAPFKAVFFPEKSDRFALQPLTKLKAIEEYYRGQSGYWERVFKPYRCLHFEKVCQLFSRVRAYKMSFTKDYIDNQAILSILSEV